MKIVEYFTNIKNNVRKWVLCELIDMVLYALNLTISSKYKDSQNIQILFSNFDYYVNNSTINYILRFSNILKVFIKNENIICKFTNGDFSKIILLENLKQEEISINDMQINGRITNYKNLSTYVKALDKISYHSQRNGDNVVYIKNYQNLFTCVKALEFLDKYNEKENQIYYIFKKDDCWKIIKKSNKIEIKNRNKSNYTKLNIDYDVNSIQEMSNREKKLLYENNKKVLQENESNSFTGIKNLEYDN